MYIDLPPLPAMFSRMGITRSCAVSIILYLTGCLYINARLPAGESVFHYPIPSVPLISLMILGSYGYLLWHMHKKQPCGRSYFWILATAITFYLLMSTFCYVKAAIPFLHPYALDTFLQRLDIWLHFGIRPYDIIAPHLTPRMIFLLDHLYNEGWLYSMFIYVLWQIFTASSNPGRLHFSRQFSDDLVFHWEWSCHPSHVRGPNLLQPTLSRPIHRHESSIGRQTLCHQRKLSTQRRH